jgi:hypothetical protein
MDKSVGAEISAQLISRGRNEARDVFVTLNSGHDFIPAFSITWIRWQVTSDTSQR